MKIKRFNKDTLPVRVPGVPAVRFNNAGCITFNKAAVSQLGLQSEVGIEFIQDEERPKDWYIVVSASENALKLRDYKGNFMVANAVIANSVLKMFDAGATSVSFLIGKEPTEHEGEQLWPVITSSYKPRLN